MMVDWSAAATPKTGADSVWFALHRVGEETPERLENPATRRAALDQIAALAAAEADAGRRIVLGFDFPFGYPAGAAAKLADAAADGALWARLWATLGARIEDGPKNANNRFAVAEAFNAGVFDGLGPFWGRPPKPFRRALPEKKPSGYGVRYPAERRLVERRAASTQPVWKLFTNGSVGGQALMGVAGLERLRNDERLAARSEVWPFETGLTLGLAPILIAEIYPSLRAPDPAYAVKDAGQVASIAARLARLAADERLARLFEGAPDLTTEERETVVAEEAWIVGVGAEKLLAGDD